MAALSIEALTLTIHCTDGVVYAVRDHCTYSFKRIEELSDHDAKIIAPFPRAIVQQTIQRTVPFGHPARTIVVPSEMGAMLQCLEWLDPIDDVTEIFDKQTQICVSDDDLPALINADEFAQQRALPQETTEIHPVAVPQ